MKPKRDKYLMVADFETTVFGDINQEKTDVWAAAAVGLEEEDLESNVKIFNSIKKFFDYLFILKEYDLIVYFHNLKFDGSFILNYLINNGWKPWTISDNGVNKYCSAKVWCQPNKTFTTSISNKGLWYSIKIRKGKQFIEFRDSLKLLPFSVKDIGKSFETKHKKLEMEYKGLRFPGCKITDGEKKYIANDVLVVKESLNIMFAEGHKKMTIGSCCYDEYKKIFKRNHIWSEYFPCLDKKSIDGLTNNVGDYIRKSYKGGWCYYVDEKSDKIFANGTTADVNSLYPSMMHSESGNRYPIGLPTGFIGDIPEEAKLPDKYYFIRVKTRFYIKDGKLPTIQIKNSWLYSPIEWLKSSDYIDKKGKSHKLVIGIDGKIIECIPTLTLTKTDWELMQEHYNLEDTEILDGCYFNTEIGLFDEYINKYAEIKMNSKGAKRTLAKLFLNNLYGKFATSTDSSYKMPYLNDNKCLRMSEIEENNKEPGYIPIGSAITSYARNFTIRAAQKNYYGPDKPGFIYADTDSIHCDLKPDEIKGAPEDPVKFNHWKYESCWDYAIFVRQKTYIEHITHENRKEVEPYYSVKCAGMPDKAKNNFMHSMQQDLTDEEYDNLTEYEQKFYDSKLTINDFKVGLKVPGLLKSKNIQGGTLLIDGDYIMRMR